MFCDSQGGQTSSLEANRDRINARSHVEEDDERTRPPRLYKRKSPIIVWKLAQRESIKI